LITLENITKISVNSDDRKKWTITTCDNNVMYLRCPDSRDRSAWITAISNNRRIPKELQLSPVVTKAETKAGVIGRSLVHVPRPTITFNELKKTGRTLDLILVQTKSGIKPALIRGFTRAEYDHIGLILRMESGEMYIFEALKVGVMLTALDSAQDRWLEEDMSCVLRRLRLPGGATDEMLKRLGHFVDETCGHAYGWNLTKMMRKKSVANFDDRSRTFFCSELVAAAYKEMGLLRPDIPSSHYPPGDFAEDKITLLQGASFGEAEEITLVRPNRRAALSRQTR